MASVTFPFPFPANLEIIFPEIIVAVMAMVILLLGLFLSKEKQQMGAWLAIATCIATAVMTLNVVSSESVMTFYGFFVLDPFAAFTKLLMLAATIFGIVLSLDYMKQEANVGEYYSLMLFALLGMMLMVSATNFVTMYLGLELMALSVYVLVGYQRDLLRSSEAALKYFILGSLSSGMLLYGISFLYGTTGSFDFNLVGEAIANHGDSARTATLVGMLFLLAGMTFKISVVPFHMWTPDAYEGAPTPITAFMSVAPKVAGLAILMRVLVDVLPALQHDYIPIFSWMAVL
ncbi:MAG: NADH-quinone oxidoreductase subunit N, partial [Mariprofundaceae bacterium]